VNAKSQKTTPKTARRRTFIEILLPYLLFIFLGYCLADLGILSFRDQMLPNQPPPAPPKSFQMNANESHSDFDSITARNIFSSDGIIPDPLMGSSGPSQEQEMAPVLSSLPLALRGTIVTTDPTRAIADIDLKSKNQVLAYRVGYDIDKLATLVKVERNRVIFKNSNNGRMEYIEMKSEGQKISLQGSKSSSGSGGKSDVAQVAPNKFEIKRSDLLKYTGDMSSILQQAAMVPVHGPNGEISGFKFLSIQPGSIYTQLGFQNGDTIKGVNGEKVDSPAKAMELYNALKTSNNIKITVERDGRDTDMDYNVK
jgi:general secretion pathway protein C